MTRTIEHLTAFRVFAHQDDPQDTTRVEEFSVVYEAEDEPEALAQFSAEYPDAVADFVREEDRGETLKPCPFCGGTPVKVTTGEPGEHAIQCNGCGAASAVVMAIKDGPEGHLAFLWNRRAADEKYATGSLDTRGE